MNSQHQPEKLMDAVGLKEGMTITDIGAGRGRMTVFFSLKVGKGGRVYANDIDKNALAYLENRCKSNNMTNVKTFPGRVDNPMLPTEEVDIAFMISTYHHLEKPVEMMRNTIPSLRKYGILVIVERDPVKTGQTGRESTSREKLTQQAAEEGLEIIEVNTELLERDNIYFLKPK
ncbi:MAG TPA: class I SAM-dependent methyltransferase [Bacteroidales bacterium]|nr:class I SAM-dependent methyltransferase [Bacteroidales bacterium]HPM87250.1 class I SAM-dependent methyltransferase [Bacteroidales bacterium]